MRLIKVFVCDNDYVYSKCLLEQLTAIFASLLTKTEIQLYNSSEDCLTKIKQEAKAPDVVFLEIDLPGMTGFELSKKLKNEYREILVVFITEKEELVFESFDYHPFSFIRKKAMDYRFELEKVCRDIIKTCQQKKNVEIRDIDSKSLFCVSIEDILFVQSDNHNLIYSFKDREQRSRERGTIKEAITKLQPQVFIRPHRSFLVNATHISCFSIRNKTIVLDSKDIIYVSRSMKNVAYLKYKEFLRAYQY